jgi:hypothetical protein
LLFVLFCTDGVAVQNEYEMKKLILSIVFVIIGIVLFAQNNDDSTATRPVNSFNLNLFGDASLISVDYERIFLIDPIFILTSKIGLGYNEEFQTCINLFGPSDCSPPDKYLTIPHHITGNLGKGQHFFEFGLGRTIIMEIQLNSIYFTQYSDIDTYLYGQIKLFSEYLDRFRY